MAVPWAPSELLDVFFEHAPVGLALIDRELRFQRINETAATMIGSTIEAATGTDIAELVARPGIEVVERVLAGEAVVEVELVGPRDDMGRLRRFSTTCLPLPDEGGEPVGVAALVVETTGRREVEDALRMAQRRVELALEGTGTGTFEWHIQTDEVRWSDNVAEMRGRERGWHPTTFDAWLDTLHPDDRDAMRAAAMRAAETGQGYHREFRTKRADGAVRWAETRTYVLPDDRGRPMTLVGLVADVTERRRREDANAFLSAATLELVRSLEIAPTLRRLADLAVDVLADWCCIVLAEGDEDLRTVAEAGVPPAAPPDVEEVARSGAFAIRGGTMAVPLVARGATLGALGFAAARDFTPAELELAAELGRRAGLAVDNARLHVQARDAAEQLQRSLLPEAPGAPGVDVAVSYRPGEDGMKIGGDWYDVYPLPGGCCVIVVGDVVGRGLKAAASMGRVNAWLRTHAVRRADPAEVLTDLDEDVELLGGVSFATCTVTFFDPETGVARVASAGHLPMILVAGGTASFVEGATGPPLGAGPAARVTDTFTVPAGGTLVLYTDGLVERRAEPLDDRLEMLRAAVDGAESDPQRIVETALATMLAGEIHPDDAVVLAVRRS